MPDFPPKTLFSQELMPCVTLFLLGDQSCGPRNQWELRRGWISPDMGAITSQRHPQPPHVLVSHPMALKSLSG